MKTGLDFRLLAATSFFERIHVGDGTACGRTTSNKTAFVSCHDPFPPNAPLHPTPLRIFKLEKHTISGVAEIVCEPQAHELSRGNAKAFSQ
jgi:hypothetical protein